MGKRQRNYFEMLRGLAEYPVKTARALWDVLQSYDVQKLPERIDSMQNTARAADQAKCEMTELLAREFITPIDREDIVSLSQEIGHIVDSAEEILLRLYMFNIQIIRPDAFRFAELIVSCCCGLEELINEFENYKKSLIIRKITAEVHQLNSKGNQLCTDAVRTLYTSSYSPTEVCAWTAIFDNFKKCCDTCGRTSEKVEIIIAKNS